MVSSFLFFSRWWSATEAVPTHCRHPKKMSWPNKSLKAVVTPSCTVGCSELKVQIEARFELVSSKETTVLVELCIYLLVSFRFIGIALAKTTQVLQFLKHSGHRVQHRTENRQFKYPFRPPFVNHIGRTWATSEQPYSRLEFCNGSADRNAWTQRICTLSCYRTSLVNFVYSSRSQGINYPVILGKSLILKKPTYLLRLDDGIEGHRIELVVLK